MLDLEKVEVKLPTSLDHRKSKGIPEKHVFLLKDIDCVDQNKLLKILKEMGILD